MGGELPRHHVPTAELLAHAAGTLSAGRELLVACHLTRCPRCREVVDRSERLWGERFQAVVPAPDRVSSQVPPELWAALEAPRAPDPPRPVCAVFPGPLVAHTGPMAAVSWRPVAPGLRASVLRELTTDAERVFLLDFRASTRLPSHSHTGVERAAVLRGGFVADGESYGQGDVSWCDTDHRDVVVDDDGPCTTLFVTEGPLRLGLPLLDRLLDGWMLR